MGAPLDAAAGDRPDFSFDPMAVASRLESAAPTAAILSKQTRVGLDGSEAVGAPAATCFASHFCHGSWPPGPAGRVCARVTVCVLACLCASVSVSVSVSLCVCVFVYIHDIAGYWQIPRQLDRYATSRPVANGARRPARDTWWHWERPQSRYHAGVMFSLHQSSRMPVAAPGCRLFGSGMASIGRHCAFGRLLSLRPPCG